jgi:tellurite methyltransferase
MRTDRNRWEERYRARGRHGLDLPSQFLQQHQHHIPAGPVLDIAAGDGRNAIHLARLGYTVDAIDIAFAGLQRIAQIARYEHLPIRLVQADLDDFPLRLDHYAAVINMRYLQRSLFEALKRALRPGGVIIFESFLIDQRFLGHPTNPDHLLQHGELRERLHGLDIIVAEEGRFETESGPAFLARAVARRPL